MSFKKNCTLPFLYLLLLTTVAYAQEAQPAAEKPAAKDSSANAQDSQPDQGDLLALLQKIGGKDWNVTAVPEGYLMTYAQPITSSSKKIDSLRLKIIFGKALSATEMENLPRNPYSELPEPPLDPKAKSELNRTHFSICSPLTWANGSKYTIFVTTNKPQDDTITPQQASNSFDNVLNELDTQFHFMTPHRH